MQVDLVVIGLGYVGLPLVREATSVGLSVVGYDIGQGVVDSLNGGRSHVDDISDDDVARMLAAGFRATTDESAAGRAGHHRDLRAHPAVRGRWPRPDRGARRRADGRAAAAPGHAGGAGVDHLPRDHR